MTTVHGFTLIEEREIAEINSVSRLYRHDKTGAEVLSIENDDENKSFCVGFTTPAPDDTGLPHILEHSVLCGSRKYPVKDPFVQLLKTSLKTFLNAMTFDDMTIYPVASTNLKDFYNLVDIYMDAVFFPLITPETLMQEGWHYETNGDGDSLIYKGVVFNEMKAYYSNPDLQHSLVIDRNLYPDTPYANSAGGVPSAIPDLSYEQFKTFHETYYHPSNARIIFYGDDDPQERLRLVDEFISEFEAQPVDAELPLQPTFSEPKVVEAAFDAGDEGADGNKSMVRVSWLLPEITDRLQVTELSVLAYALTATSASPLRKALLDSGLGEDITGGSLDTYKRQMNYSVGLKNIQLSDANRVEALILETLGDLAENGIEKETVKAALNTIEFNLRERNTGRFPRGLATAISALPAWIHGANPMDAIAFEERLATVKQRFEDNDQYFEEMIGEYFLNNPHRVTTIMHPDPTVGPEREQAEKDRLSNVQARLTDDELEDVKEIAETLRIMQETPDDPTKLASLPKLTLDDIEREIKPTPQEVFDRDGTTLYFHEQPTAGIVYTDVGFDLRVLPQEYLQYVPMFATALTKLGTSDQNFVQLSQRIGMETGGIYANKQVNTHRQNRGDYVANLILRGKSTSDKVGGLLDIYRDILLTVDWDNKDRFKQLVLERKARSESYLAMVGHQIAGRRTKAHYAMKDWVEEHTGGASHLFFLRDLAERIDTEWDAISQTLKDIAALLVKRGGMVVNITAERADFEAIQPQLDGFLGAIPDGVSERQTWTATDLPKYEGLTMPLQVNFNARSVNLFDLGYELDGSVSVITKHVYGEYTWQRIRVQGGAYGGSLSFSGATGTATFLSWRDPNIVNTQRVFKEASDYLQNVDLTDEEMEQAIIGAIGGLDSHELPDSKGYQQMIRHQVGYTDEMRQTYRNQVLDTTVEDFRQFGAWLKHVADGAVAVVGSPEAIEKASEELDNPLTMTKLQ